MTFEQSLSSRLVAIPVNIIIAVPYGFYRDFAMRQARRISPSGWMKNIADVVAYVTFQSPVYVAILLVVGADWHQIAAAVSSNMAVSMMMGAAYGYFLDYCRRLFRVSPTSRPKPELIQKSDWQPAAFCQLYCVSPNRPLRKRSSAMRELNPCGIP
jgi:acylphosphatase